MPLISNESVSFSYNGSNTITAGNDVPSDEADELIDDAEWVSVGVSGGADLPAVAFDKVVFAQ